MTSHSSEWDVEVTDARVAVLLTGGIKTGNDRWYDAIVPRADDLYDAHLESLGHDGRSDG